MVGRGREVFIKLNCALDKRSPLSQLLDKIEKFPWFDWLREVGVEAGIKRPLTIVKF